jgi:predicted N-acyltransferase
LPLERHLIDYNGRFRLTTQSGPDLKTKLFNSISEIPKAQWNQLLNDRSCTFSHEFWTLIEESDLNDFSYRHVLFLDENDQAVGCTTFFLVTTDIAIFAPPTLRALLERIRRFFPNFLKLGMVECGSPIILNSPPLISVAGIDPRKLIKPLADQLLRTARQEGKFLIVVRDFEPDAEELLPSFTELGYHTVDSLPNTYLDIRWQSIEEYRADLKSYYRSKLNNHLRRNAGLDVRHELVNDFADKADELCAQWLVVHSKASEFKREVLTPKFYREFSATMGEHSKALYFYRGNKFVGHVLLLHDGDLLRWLYFGRKEAANDSLYIYVGHAVVETAIMLGAKRLEMGLTTYAIKQDLGGRLTSMKFSIRATSRLINPFVGWGYGLLNKPPKTSNKMVFKKGSPPPSVN